MTLPLIKITIDWSHKERMVTVVKSSRRGRIGLYQITELRGEKEFLRYVGKSYDNVYERLKAHWNEWVKETYRNRAFVRIGILKVTTENRRLRDRLLREVEGAIINVSKPTDNFQNINGYNIRQHNLLITNNNSMLPRIIDTRLHKES
jgi:hypothetical protein